MKNQLLMLTLGTIITFILGACGGGGRSLKLPGAQCKANYNPYPTELPPNQKMVDMKPGAKEMPVGDYTYETSRLYYVGANDARIEVRDTKQKDGTFKAERYCLRNAGKGISDLFIRSEGLSKMTIDEAFNVVAESKVLSFSTLTGKLEPKVEAGKQNLNSPELAYKDTRILRVVMLKLSDTKYEVRSESLDANGARYWMSVILNYSKPKLKAL